MNQIRKKEQPKAIVTIGPFTFIVPTSIYVDDAIQRVKTQTKIVPVSKGLMIKFPNILVPAPFGIGIIEMPLGRKTIPWKQIKEGLTNYQVRNLISQIMSGITNIKSEKIEEGGKTKITIPVMHIPIY